MSKARQLAQKPSQPTGRKNLIINGAMQVNQRGDKTGHFGVSYILDRWEVEMFNTGDATIDVSQDTDAPTGFTKSMKVETNVADASQDSNAQFRIQQQIEAQDINHLKFYQSNPDSVTISFWVKSNLTGSFPMALKLSDNNSSDGSTNTRIYNTTYSISTADTWEKKTATITLDSSTSETKPTGNNFGMALLFWLAAGSARDGANADVWNDNGNATIAADNLDLLANAANEWYITGVQLEVGSIATEFEHRSYGEELALCQRYYYQISGNTADQSGLCAAFVSTTTKAYGYVTLPVSMRAENQSVTLSGGQILTSGANLNDCSLDAGFDENLNVVGLIVDKTSGSDLTDGEAALLRLDNLATAKLTVNSEL